MWEYNNTDELYHYGILGMKWGHHKAIMRENRDYRNKVNKFKLEQKWNKQSIEKQNRINNVDKKIEKYGSVKKFKNRNRAKMVGIGVGAATLTGLHNVGVLSRLGAKGLGGAEGTKKFIERIANAGELVGSSNPIKRAIGERRVKMIMKSAQSTANKNVSWKDSKRARRAIVIGTAVIGAIAAKKIYDKHRENKIANDYEYRQYVKKNKKHK